jgi:hypothetical protein
VLLRPLLNALSPHSSKSARGLCDEAAGKISQLMDIYSRTYGLDKSSFINSNSLTSAAIIHVFSVSKPIGSLEKKQQTEVYLAEAIQKLHEMKADRFLRIVQNVLFKWRANVPASVLPLPREDMRLILPISLKTVGICGPWNGSVQCSYKSKDIEGCDRLTFFFYFLMINRNDLTVHRTIKTHYRHAFNQSAPQLPLLSRQHSPSHSYQALSEH